MRLSLVTLVFVILFSFLISCSQKENRETYKNPIELKDEWEEYGLGDPYVLKYNGTYYLYVSTRDSDIGVKVWSSINLADWQYEGLATEEPKTKAAYAPEVIHWNGYFYMYTSPGGNGHYVLKSDSPTGPFSLATENIGKSIDGNVFIDDDGSMYFSHSGASGIEVSPMSDPVTFGQSVTTDAYMDGWTEGSTIFKRNGKYYMTYTGNHVFSDAYRIDYAISDHPIQGYIPSDQNPIVIDTEGPLVGLGHNSIIKGPNLDTDYIFYHNLEGQGIVGPLRHMNMDMIAWNGDKMEVQGPTHTEQLVPELPAFEDRFDRKRIGASWQNINGGKWEIHDQTYLRQSSIGTNEWYKQVIKAETEDNYTAEFHTKMVEASTESSNSLFGVAFSYQDEENHGVALFSPDENNLLTRFIVDGIPTDWESSDLPTDFDYTKLHQIRVEKDLDTFRIYVDGMLKQTSDAVLGGGKIGYITMDTSADFAYTAFSNEVNGSGVWDAFKPLPGMIQAVHYHSSDESIARKNDDNSENYRKGPVKIQNSSEGGFNVRLNQPNESLSYNVNIAETGMYHADLRLATEVNDVKLRIWQGDRDISGVISVPNTGGLSRWKTITVKDLELEEGNQELKVELVQGEANFYTMIFYEGEDVPGLSDSFTDHLELEWTMYESYWAIKNDVFQSSTGDFSKALIGETGWNDYTVEVEIQLKEEDGDAGILVRGLNAANGMERNQNNEDFLQGYYAYIKTDGIYLGKQNYGRENLSSISESFSIDTWHHMKVDVKGTTIQVFVNDMDTPKIIFEDSSIQPFTHGKVGLQTANNRALFDNFKVTPN